MIKSSGKNVNDCKVNGLIDQYDGNISVMVRRNPSINRSGVERSLNYVMMIGIFILIIGMAVPAPEHAYEYLVVLTLFLPGLFMLILRPGSIKALWQSPSIKLVVMLLAWSSISLIWSSTDQTRDWVGRCLGIFLFLYCWVCAFEKHEEFLHQFLFVCGLFMSLIALLGIITYYPQVLAGGRIQGFAEIENTNKAAPFMAVASIWLCTLPLKTYAMRIVRALAVVLLLMFICLTFSRGAWGAIFAALVVLAVSRGGVFHRRLLILLAVCGVIAVVVFLPELLERGWSYRPAILQNSWELFWQQPLFGIGQGTLTHFNVNGYEFNHTQNMFVQVAVQLGIPGIVLLLGIWLPLGWRGWRCRHIPLGRLMLGMWVYTTVQGQVELTYMINSPGVEWLCAWVPLAIGCVLKVPDEVRNKHTYSGNPEHAKYQI